MNKNELTFSKEIAETLGIESAVILNLYKENSLDDISSMQGLLESVKKNVPFFLLACKMASFQDITKPITVLES